MLELRVVAEKRSWIRHHIHIQATLVPRGPLLEGESALLRMDDITSMEGLDQKSPENRLVGVVLQPCFLGGAKRHAEALGTTFSETFE